MRVIAGGKQLGTMSGSTITLGAAVNDELTIGEATAMAVDGDITDDSGLDGEVILLRVEYSDPATDGTDFEVGTWTYSQTAGTLVRVATEFSSSGLTAVTFTSTVVVYGVLTSAKVPEGGWLYDKDTWTYASATTFTISGSDETARFPVGAKLRIDQSGLKYFYVVDATFSTNTTVTVTAGDDYTIANAAIVNPHISLAATPEGFPQWFNFSPSYTNLTVGNGTLSALFRIDGNSMFIQSYFTLGSTSSISGAIGMTTPVTMANFRKYRGLGACSFLDSGSAIYTGIAHSDSATTIALVIHSTASSYTKMSSVNSTVPFTWTTSDGFMFSTTGIEI